MSSLWLILYTHSACSPPTPRQHQHIARSCRLCSNVCETAVRSPAHMTGRTAPAFRSRMAALLSCLSCGSGKGSETSREGSETSFRKNSETSIKAGETSQNGGETSRKAVKHQGKAAVKHQGKAVKHQGKAAKHQGKAAKPRFGRAAAQEASARTRTPPARHRLMTAGPSEGMKVE